MNRVVLVVILACVTAIAADCDTCDATIVASICKRINVAGSLGSCSTGSQGVCSAGTFACNDHVLSCTQATQPSAEVCDGLDNNCNGQVDEANPGGGAGCSTGLQGVCSAGTTKCQNGAIACLQNLQPSTEVCDNKDNNCNGQVDEGNPGGGVGCSTGLQGVCAAGTTKCQSGAIVCTQNVQAVAEVCGDGLDNNCNGQVDEGCNAGFIACAGSPQWTPVTCSTNMWVWSSDKFLGNSVTTAANNKVLWTGCVHGSIDTHCSLNGQGYVSTAVSTMSGCNTSWYHLGGVYTGDCGGHDGDQVRRLSPDASHCYNY